MISQDLIDWFNARWINNMGAIDGQDIAFIDELIEQARPRTVVEIGCASGMSTCIMASLLSSQGGAEIHSFDLLQNYYVDPSKEVGYLLNEAPPHPGVTVSVNRGKTSLDVGAHVTAPIDLCFIDAAHRHPWPLIDTLAVLPLMRPGGLIIHHDLKMYCATEGENYATGPRIVFDQAPPESRIFPDDANQARGRAIMRSRGISHNIYALRVPETYRAYGARLCEGFYLGWDPQQHRLIPPVFAAQFESFIAQHYAPWVTRAWKEGMRRYAHLSDPATPAVIAPKSASLLKRVARRLSRG